MADEERGSSESETFSRMERVYGGSQQPSTQNVKSSHESDTKRRAPKLILNLPQPRSSPAYVKPSQEDEVCKEEQKEDTTIDLVNIINQLRAELKQVKMQLRDMKKKEASAVHSEDSAHKNFLQQFGTQENKTYMTKKLNEGLATNRVEIPDERGMFIRNTAGYTRDSMFDEEGEPIYGVPKNKDMKLPLAKFNAKETYKGLGTGINEWINWFARQLERAQMASGFWWSDSVKMDVLEDHLEGKALEYWQIKRPTWTYTTLDKAMESLKMNYRCTLSDRQAMTLFDKVKPAHRGYKEHLNYLMQVNAAGGGHFDRNVLKSMVHRSGAELMSEISSKYERNRTDYIEHATELADYADELWNERSLNQYTGRPGRDGSSVNTVDSKKVESRTCHNCQRKGHVARDCKDRKKFSEEKKRTNNIERADKESFAFSVGYKAKAKYTTTTESSANVAWHNSIEWILDSGCGRHLTGSPDLLGEDTDKAGTSLVLPDGTRTQSLRKGKIEMVTQVDQEARHIVVEDVEYVPGFKRNLLSYVSLEKKGVRLQYEGNKRYLVSKFGKKLAEVKSEGDVLIVRGVLSGALANAVLVHNVIADQDHVSEAVHEDTLYNWHKRFGHQSYDAIF